jgi:hypothetical protein
MKLTRSAGRIGSDPDRYIGKTVTFTDHHGRMVTGTLQAATAPLGAAYATLTTDDRRVRAVFVNTPVAVN